MPSFIVPGKGRRSKSSGRRKYLDKSNITRSLILTLNWLFNATSVREALISTAQSRYILIFTVVAAVFLPLGLSTVKTASYLCIIAKSII
jgi:hypothetical protein